MKTQIIYLLRHGVTNENETGIYQGKKIDSALNEQGRRQANQLGKFLAKNAANIGTVYASPTKRTVATAAIITHYLSISSAKDAENLALPYLIVEPMLYEIDHGEWSGFTREEVEKKWPDIAEEWWHGNQMNVKFPGGEYVWEARKRALKVFEKLLRKNQNDLAIVGHGRINALIIASILETNVFEPIAQDNACINIIERCTDRAGSKLYLRLVNGTSHLDEPQILSCF